MSKTEPDAPLREQIADAKARQAKGEGEPGDAELAHYDHPLRHYARDCPACNAAPERRIAQRRVRLTVQDDPIRRFIPDRRQNAAVESPILAAPYTPHIDNYGRKSQAPFATPESLGLKTKDHATVLDLPHWPVKSTLPLSAIRLRATAAYIRAVPEYRNLLADADYMEEAALRAIELEKDMRGMIANAIVYRRRIRELEQRVAEKDGEPLRIALRSCHMELAEISTELDDAGIPSDNHSTGKALSSCERVNLLAYYWEQAAEETEKAEALVAEKDGEIARLTTCLAKANSNHEEFERRYYLELDRREEAEAELATAEADLGAMRAAFIPCTPDEENRLRAELAELRRAKS